MANKKKGLSREQAAELYTDLQRTMAKMLKNEAEYLAGRGQIKSKAASQASSKTAKNNPLDSIRNIQSSRRSASGEKGAALAVSMILFCGLAKVTFSLLEYTGIIQVAPAEASIVKKDITPHSLAGMYSKEEIQVLTSLDARRAELDQKNKRLDARDRELLEKDKEFAARLTELRDLTEKLNNEREKDDRKQESQLEQLSNVYGSMNPEEAAHLMEQLDITIALALIQRMPEKRIGQILASMSPERALALTKMLSGKIK